jgi:Flp pilus assembly protein TadG
MPFCRHIWSDRQGAAAAEAALVMPLLLLVMAGLIDGSRVIVRAMQVDAAAQAGAEYARKNGWNRAAIQSAVAEATSLAVTASPAPQLIRACATASGVQSTNAPTCPGGGPPGDFVVVTAQATYSALMPWPGVPVASTLQGRAMVRLQ